MSRQSGFTLLETLVAMTLMSLLMLALFGGFRAGIASWQVAERHIEDNEPQLLLNRMLYRHLAQLYVPESAETVFRWAPSEVAFVGAPDRVFYVAPLALSADNQLYAIELASAPGGREGVWIRYLPYDQLGPEGLVSSLNMLEYTQVSNSLRVRFEYFSGDQWQEELGIGTTPTLVRVHWAADDRIWSSTTFRVTGA